MKTDLSKIAVVIIADVNGKMMQRFSPNSYMTQGSVMTIRTEYDDQANGVNSRTKNELPIQNGSRSVFDEANELLKKLTDDERMELFADYCKYCGDVDPSCQCWNDE